MATMNWRTINVDLFDPESSANFDVSSILPSVPSVSTSEVQTLSSQIKQLLRGGDAEGALRGALENAPYGGDTQAKVSSAEAPPAAKNEDPDYGMGNAYLKQIADCRIGHASGNRSGNAPIDQAIGHVAYA